MSAHTDETASNAEASAEHPGSAVDHLELGLHELFHFSEMHAVAHPPRIDFPHEATHRRYEHPRYIDINQAAVGYTKIFAPGGLHYVKLLGGFITLAADGTIQFVQGQGSANYVERTGAINISASGGFVLPVSSTETPWLAFSPDLEVGLVTSGAAALAQGWLVVTVSPADQ